jgi:serine phosphatase RsbU (regulator of sigma subunit)/ligand-binding sensor domain-containing protein
MKNGLPVTMLLLFVTVTGFSQINRTGTPIINWTDATETPGDLQNWCITMDNRGVMYFGNQLKGIVTYDGLSWGLIRMTSQQRINALATDYRGIVYAGGETDFGFLQPDNNGELLYKSLADRMKDSLARREVQMIYSIASDSNTVYFTDRRKLYLYDIKNDSLTMVDMARDLNLKNAGRLLARDGKLIIADNKEGLFWYNEGRIEQMKGGNEIKMVRFMSLIPYDRESIMIATFENGIFIYNCTTGQVSNLLSPADNDRLKGDLVSGAVNIPGNRFAVGVTNGEGVFVFSHEGELLQQLSVETTSLQESTVTAMYCDYSSNAQLWFCTMGYINRAYVSLPVTEFGSGSGIRTTLGDIREFNGSVFVSHDAGLYTNFTDNSGRVEFAKLDQMESQAFDLITTSTEDGKVLIAATFNGLSQVDTVGNVTSYLDRIYFTALKADNNDPSALLAGSDDGIIRTIKFVGHKWTETGSSKRNEVRGMVMEIEQTRDGDWWILTRGPNSLYRMEYTPSDTSYTLYDRASGLASDTLNHIVSIDNELYVCTGKGIYRYNNDADRFEKDSQIVGKSFDNVLIDRMFRTPAGDICIAGYDTRHFDALVTPTSQGFVIFRRQFDFLPDIATTDIEFIDGNIWLVKGRSIYVIDKSKLGFGYGSFKTIFTAIIAGSDHLMMKGAFYTQLPDGIRIPSAVQPAGTGPVLGFSDNDISFNWTTTSYIGEDRTEYRYRLDGFDHEWSKWERRTFKDYTNLPYGHYTFRLVSKIVTGLESEELAYDFSVKKPWYLTVPAIICYVLAAALLVFAIITFYTRRLKRENIRLEKLVKQRTVTVVRQKEELEASIHYASRIQRALLPSEKLLYDATTNYFILFKPRDIVSGDFYWISRREERLFVAVADCTGHGVPGAFMSLLGISFLDEIINKLSFTGAGNILDELRKQVIASLKQIGEADEQKDGMDMGLIIIDYKKRIVEYAGAYNPCLKVRPMNEQEIRKWENGELEYEEGSLANGKYMLETVYGSKMPIGISSKLDQEFTQYEWEFDRDISYYMFTDGYIDQFNGVTGKKFMKKNFKKLLLDIQDYPMSKQKEILEERLRSWMGSSAQIDDILVLGMKPE